MSQVAGKGSADLAALKDRAQAAERLAAERAADLQRAQSQLAHLSQAADKGSADLNALKERAAAAGRLAAERASDLEKARGTRPSSQAANRATSMSPP